MNFVADNIGGNTIYISLVIRVSNRYRKSNTISNLWIAQPIMIVDQINMVKLEILSNIKK